ncbi:isochorismatase family protein [Lacticaseibacillus saniviri]
MTRALLVIDLQNGVGPLIDAAGLLTRVNQRIAAFRQRQQPIIFIRHQEPGMEKNTDAWQLVAGLDHRDTDHYVDKTHPDSFHKTVLQQTLDDLDVDELEICGAETQFCVDTTIKAAFDRGYPIVMKHHMTSTEEDDLIPVAVMVTHYERIWDHHFVTFTDE